MPEFSSFGQYRSAARDFMGGGAGPGVIERMRGTDILRVDPNTGLLWGSLTGRHDQNLLPP